MNRSFIAVIDDEEDLVSLFRDALSNMDGIRVFGFTDPTLALEHFKINHSRYKLVISDYRMPGMNGIDFLTETMKIDNSVGRIMISAFEEGSFVSKESKCVDRFLQKPIRLSELISAIEQELKLIRVSK